MALSAFDQSLQSDLLSYDTPLQGSGLPAHSLQGLLQSNKVLIIHFLRHFGCIFCQQSVQNLYKASSKLPPIYFVHQSTPARGDEFFAQHFPGARHIADADFVLYRRFGIKHLGWFWFLNPKTVVQGFESLLQGNRQGANEGDIWVLSGTFLFNRGKLIWAHRAQRPGDDPSWERLGK